MNNITAFIESGLLELYVLGIATPEEEEMVEQMALLNPEVVKAMESFSDKLEQSAMRSAIGPPDMLKAGFFASIRALAEAEEEKKTWQPPFLNANASISDFSKWLNDPAFSSPAVLEDIYAKVIFSNEQLTTLIVWIKKGTAVGST